MRISDWSSDVCSFRSGRDRRGRKGRRQDRTACGFGGGSQGRIKMAPLPLAGGAARLASLLASRSGEGVGLARDRKAHTTPLDRKSDGSGKRVSVRETLGGSLYIKKKKLKINETK